MHIDVETMGKYTRGMTLADRRLNSKAKKNVNVITDINLDKFKEIFVETLI